MVTQTQSLDVIYEGKALDGHKMDILSLAKSLQGLGEAIYAANTIVNGDAELEVNIDAELIAGSFGFKLEVIQQLKNAKDILKLLGLTTSKMIVGEATVLEVLQKLDGRKIDIVEPEKNGEKVKLIVDGEEITCTSDVEKIVNSPEIRKAVDSFIRQPLLMDGIDTFVVKSSKNARKVFVHVNKNEADKFKSPRVLFETKEEDDEFDTTVTFLSADVEKKTGWRVEFHKEKHTARMEDNEFMLRLKNKDAPSIFGELFAVKMKKITKDNGGEIKEVYTIIKVGRKFGGRKK